MKPCPFCGYKKPRVVTHRSINNQVIIGHSVVCEPPEDPCGAQGPIMKSKAKAVRGWQKRVK